MRKTLFIVAALWLVGCATPYQQKGLSGGFEETQLGENVFRVNFKGNGYTSKQRAQDFTLLRCAELSMQNGFPYFLIVDGSTQSNSGFVPGAATSNTRVTSPTRATTTTYGGGVAYSFPTTDNTIMGLKEKPDNAQGVVYDAKYVVQALRKKYEIVQDQQ